MCNKSRHSSSISGIRATFCSRRTRSLPMMRHSMNYDDTKTERERDGVSNEDLNRHRSSPSSFIIHLFPQHADAEVHFFLAQRQQVLHAVVDNQAEVGVHRHRYQHPALRHPVPSENTRLIETILHQYRYWNQGRYRSIVLLSASVKIWKIIQPKIFIS